MSDSASAKQKEVRFTRNLQGAQFTVVGGLLALLGLLPLFALMRVLWRTGHILFSQHAAWMVCLPLGLALFYFGSQMLRHAYIVFTPLGLELYPFFKPKTNMQLLFWSEIEALSLSEDKRALEIALPNERKIFVSLSPMREESRLLLLSTVAAAEQLRRPGEAA